MTKNIAQWARELVNEDNVKLCIVVVPAVTNLSAVATSGWVIYK